MPVSTFIGIQVDLTRILCILSEKLVFVLKQSNFSKLAAVNSFFSVSFAQQQKKIIIF
jgi:hypothetical protein